MSPIWTTTTAPYGPAFILVAKFVTMLVGNDVVAGHDAAAAVHAARPGAADLGAPRVARHVGANGAAALWICVLNPLVIIHLMGGVHNEMLMVGLMMAGIALTFGGHHVGGRQPDRRRGRGESDGGTCTSVHGVGVDAQTFGDRRGYAPVKAFAVATAASVLIFVAVFAVLSLVAGRRTGLAHRARRFGEDHQLADACPTAAANLDQRRSAACSCR